MQDRILSKAIRTTLAATLVAPALLIVGCATAPKTSSAVEEARSAVRTAESTPDTGKYAPTEINRARTYLSNAEGVLKEKGPSDPQTTHYAYLAKQTAHVAEQRAKEQAAIARIKSGETERQQILLSARESEANRALAAANQARNEALSAQSESQRAQAESARLAAQLAEMQASQTSRGIVLTLGDVLFDTGKSELKAGATRPIDQIAAFLSENPERRVQVEGFTDSQGSDEYNQELSQRRADAVAMAIMQRGIDAQRVRALGYGEQYPKAGNENAGSRQLNRRVEIIVSNDQNAIPQRRPGQP